jgi:hypothetical protein
MTVYVHKIYLPIPDKFKNGDTKVVSTIARNSGLSPFRIGPCKLYSDIVSKNMENAWQYSKVYDMHWDKSRKRIKNDYWIWASSGWNNPKAVRYPMGKGIKPVGSLWNGELLDYITARKMIYGPLYAEAVQKTPDWRALKLNYNDYENIVLLDYDAYDHHKLEYSLTDVLNDPNRKMGHAFVLAMLLTKDKALKQMELR